MRHAAAISNRHFFADIGNHSVTARRGFHEL
jgi:hypothetical protein